MENQDIKKYIPVGVGLLGAIGGLMLHKKFPKFGMAGKVGYIAAGGAAGYFLSKMVVEKGNFFNAVGGGIDPSAKRVPRWCVDSCPNADAYFRDGRCKCVRRGDQSNLFTNAVDESEGDLRPKKKCRHKVDCSHGQHWVGVPICQCHNNTWD